MIAPAPDLSRWFGIVVCTLLIGTTPVLAAAPEPNDAWPGLVQDIFNNRPMKDGSNVIVVPTGLGFTFDYGHGSFDRHLAAARGTGLPVRVVQDPALGWDVDVPADLAHPDRPIQELW